MRIHYRLLFFSVLFCSLPTLLWSQTRISSPYSVYGIGSIADGSNIYYQGMGGTSLAFRSPQTLNYHNPSAFAAIDTLSFVFEGGMLSLFSTQSSATASQSGNYSSLSHLLFGFPITRWWKTGIGLLPFSNVGYKISDRQVMDSVGTVDKVYEGQGGLNQVFLGNGFQIASGLSLGFNMTYIFGSIDKIRSVLFPESTYGYNSGISSSMQMNGFRFAFGAQFHKKINEQLSLGFGATYHPVSTLHVVGDELATTFIRSTSGYEYTKDTLSYVTGVRSTLSIPQAYGLGVSVKRNSKFEVGMDVSWQNWENYQVNETIDTLKNSWQVSLGGQIFPSLKSNNYFARTTYRFGMRYGKTYLQLKDNQLDEWAVSVGFGFPLKKTKSAIHLGFEYGQRGTTTNNLIMESFFRISLGVSMYEHWFIRRKFN